MGSILETIQGEMRTDLFIFLIALFIVFVSLAACCACILCCCSFVCCVACCCGGNKKKKESKTESSEMIDKPTSKSSVNNDNNNNNNINPTHVANAPSSMQTPSVPTMQNSASFYPVNNANMVRSMPSQKQGYGNLQQQQQQQIAYQNQIKSVPRQNQGGVSIQSNQFVQNGNKMMMNNNVASLGMDPRTGTVIYVENQQNPNVLSLNNDSNNVVHKENNNNNNNNNVIVDLKKSTTKEDLSDGEKEVLEVLTSLDLQEYFDNFKNSKIRCSDMKMMKLDDLEDLVPDKFPRRRLEQYIEDLLEKEKIGKKNEEKEKWEISPKMVKFGDLIQSGSFGTVKKGILSIGIRDIEVAIKEMAIKSEEDKNCVIHEIKVMSEMKNDYILACFGGWIDEEKQIASIVLELCEKGDLFDFKKKGYIKVDKIRRVKFMLDIAKGMEYLHSINIIHRDLKTQNVLLTKDNKIKICDFGTSKHTASVNQTFVGTVEYLASEQYDVNLATEPQKVDVYSFSIIMWELWTGNTPYSELRKKCNNNQFELLQRIHQKKIRPSLEEVEDMPEDLRELMIGCWSHDPDERPEFSDIVHELTQIFRNMKKK